MVESGSLATTVFCGFTRDFAPVTSPAYWLMFAALCRFTPATILYRRQKVLVAEVSLSVRFHPYLTVKKSAHHTGHDCAEVSVTRGLGSNVTRTNVSPTPETKTG